jgi:hypothetical protein
LRPISARYSLPGGARKAASSDLLAPAWGELESCPSFQVTASHPASSICRGTRGRPFLSRSSRVDPEHSDSRGRSCHPGPTDPARRRGQLRRRRAHPAHPRAFPDRNPGLINRPKELVHAFGSAIGGKSIDIWAADNTQTFYGEWIDPARVASLLLTTLERVAYEGGIDTGRVLFFELGHNNRDVAGSPVNIASKLAQDCGGSVGST